MFREIEVYYEEFQYMTKIEKFCHKLLNIN